MAASELDKNGILSNNTKKSISSHDNTTVVSMNLSGRFANTEKKKYGQLLIEHVIHQKKVSILFGHRASFKPRPPSSYTVVGTNKSFLIFNKERFRMMTDDKHYRKVLFDFQKMGRFPYHYLPENNFVLAKLKDRSVPDRKLLVMSWLTDDCLCKTRAVSVFKLLTAFALNVSSVEEMPVVIGGTFQLNIFEAIDLLPNGVSCHGYDPLTSRRMVRSSDYFLTTADVHMPDVEPLLFSKVDLRRQRGEANINAEDAFYCDPVIGDVTFDTPSKIRAKTIEDFDRQTESRNNNYSIEREEEEEEEEEATNGANGDEILDELDYRERRISVHTLEEQIVQQPGMYENVCSVS
ncbi:DgyrCDS11207 [Dimorphilus gyrociliatus]|uniref:DgyrCDS11207 n=1 Tax=Dimorphilus gyrociliatus TaxID=2664684 RepID=A0A7I8W2M3_9ANNE|nr:DgyrCDS11207 [Dimorphilus gyrociliatus]